jgi:hypothetical protein
MSYIEAKAGTESGGRILERNRTKVFRVSLLAIHSHLYYGFYSQNIVYGKLKSENSQEYAQKP